MHVVCMYIAVLGATGLLLLLNVILSVCAPALCNYHYNSCRSSLKLQIASAVNCLISQRHKFCVTTHIHV
jgi:hypothetical protein